MDETEVATSPVQPLPKPRVPTVQPVPKPRVPTEQEVAALDPTTALCCMCKMWIPRDETEEKGTETRCTDQTACQAHIGKRQRTKTTQYTF